MKIKLRRADIIILATAHNPSIVSPQWLKDNKIIVEEPKQFIHTPDLSLFDTEKFILMVDRERLQLTAKIQDNDLLKSIAAIGAGYFKSLPHIPYRALGLNFDFLVETEETKNQPNIQIKIDSITDISSAFVDHKLKYGGIIYAKKEPYLLKLIIEPMGEKALRFNYNYHHETKGLPVETIAGYIDKYLDLYEHSQKVIYELIQLKD